MCSNFGINMHPGKKPCAVQWQLYNFATHLFVKLRRRYFPKALYTYRESGDGRPPGYGGHR